MTKSSKWVFLIIAVFAFNSCRNIQPTAPVETATIHGRVELAQQAYSQLSPPFNGVNVTLEGTNFVAVSDDSGNFTLKNVPAGTYNVRFSKAGYGELRWMSVTVTGGGNADIFLYNPIWVPVMYRFSDIVNTLNSAVVKDSVIAGAAHRWLSVEGTITSAGSAKQWLDGMVIFVSHHSDVSALPGHYEDLSYCIPGTGRARLDTVGGNSSYESTPWYPEFNSGDSIYVAVYGAPYYAIEWPYTPSFTPTAGAAMPCDYYDPIIDQPVFTSINQTPSPVIGTKVP